MEGFFNGSTELVELLMSKATDAEEARQALIRGEEDMARAIKEIGGVPHRWDVDLRKWVPMDIPVPKDEVVPQFLSECSIGGTTYALPYMRSTEACYVNKTFVEKLGYELPDVLTWDFVWEVSEAAMAKDADGNFAVNGQKTICTDTMCIMLPLYSSLESITEQVL